MIQKIIVTQVESPLFGKTEKVVKVFSNELTKDGYNIHDFFFLMLPDVTKILAEAALHDDKTVCRKLNFTFEYGDEYGDSFVSLSE